MKPRVHTIISLVVILICLIGSSVLFSCTIDVQDLAHTLFTLNSEQTSYLILLVVCLILLYDIIELSIFKVKIKTILIYSYNNTLNIFLKFSYWLISVILVLFGLIIPVLDLMGSFNQTIENIPELVLKITLILITTNFVYNLVDRSKKQIGIIKKILYDIGNITILNRAEEHEFMFDILDELSPNSEILVTHFEEPLSSLNEGEDYSYYYEKNFMKKWYSTIRTKKLKVKQIVLINSKQDVVDFEKRLDIIKDIKNYSLGYIIAPPLTVFIDFIVFPKDVLVGFSDELSSRNMGVFALLIQRGVGVTKFKNIFNDVLAAEAKFVKTFEGINETELNEMKSSVEKIQKYSKNCRNFFKIFNDV